MFARSHVKYPRLSYTKKIGGVAPLMFDNLKTHTATLLAQGLILGGFNLTGVDLVGRACFAIAGSAVGP